MNRYRVTLAYDGTDFHGSQFQPELRTVQGEVGRAVAKLGGGQKSIKFAGRTDAGVHASGQEIAFDLNWGHPVQDLQKALNANFPRDMAALKVERAGMDFHPRFDAQLRRYVYTLRVSPLRDPLQSRYCWRIGPPLERGRMEEASQKLVGTHDFAAFGSPHQAGGSTVRHLEEVSWKADGEQVELTILGNAFLYHMVRHIVILLVQIGQGRENVNQVEKYLKAPEGPPAQGLAPARGLKLAEVIYQLPAP